MGASEHFPQWADETRDQAARLVAFQRWLGALLLERLHWRGPQEAQLRIAGQCRSFIERAVADLDRHGFLFKPAELSQLITEQIDRVADYQQRGEVRDIYKYLERTWDGWVSRQAEEFAQLAIRTRVHRAHMVQSNAPSMPEIVRRNLEAAHEERRARRLFRQRAQQARKGTCNPNAEAMLPGFDLF